MRRRGKSFGVAHICVPRWVETTEDDPGFGQARAALDGGAEVVCVLGGDGTVMEVVSALAYSGIPIGVLPGGTGNLVAGVLGVPLGVRRAVPALLAGVKTALDLGQLPDGRFFTFAAGMSTP